MAEHGTYGHPLTAHERAVLLGMAQGLTNPEIGRALFLSEDTIKTHGRKLFRKLGARDRANAVALGFRAGLFPRDGWTTALTPPDPTEPEPVVVPSIKPRCACGHLGPRHQVMGTRACNDCSCQRWSPGLRATEPTQVAAR